MPRLQKANLGVPPGGTGGDDQRTANSRFNANVDVLNTCVALGYAILGDSTTITPDLVGTRFGLNIGVSGKKITLPLAGSVQLNACVHLFNVGTAVAIGLQGSDGTQVSTVNRGDWITYVSDGNTYWHVAERGKMLWDETVGGNLTVGGGVNVAGRVLASGELQSASATAFRAVQGEHGALIRNDGSNVYLMQTKKGDPWGAWNDYRPFSWGLSDGAVQIDATGSGCEIGSRPTWLGGKIPWDSGNLPRPLQHSDIGAIAASGGEERDLSINDEARLVLSFTPKANSVLATASLYINIGQSTSVANDFVSYLDLFDVAANARVSTGGASIISVPNGSLYAGISSAGSLTCSIAHGNLTIGRQYQIRLWVRKVQPIGPIYPRGMSINGVVV